MYENINAFSDKLTGIKAIGRKKKKIISAVFERAACGNKENDKISRVQEKDARPALLHS